MTVSDEREKSNESELRFWINSKESGQRTNWSWMNNLNVIWNSLALSNWSLFKTDEGRNVLLEKNKLR